MIAYYCQLCARSGRGGCGGSLTEWKIPATRTCKGHDLSRLGSGEDDLFHTDGRAMMKYFPQMIRLT